MEWIREAQSTKRAYNSTRTEQVIGPSRHQGTAFIEEAISRLNSAAPSRRVCPRINTCCKVHSARPEGLHRALLYFAVCRG